MIDWHREIVTLPFSILLRVSVKKNCFSRLVSLKKDSSLLGLQVNFKDEQNTPPKYLLET